MACVRGIALGKYGGTFGLLVLDTEFFIYGSQFESDILCCHLTDADPNIGWDPVVFGIWRNNYYFITRLQNSF